MQKLVGQERFILLICPNRSKKGLKNNLEVETETVAMEDSYISQGTRSGTQLWAEHSYNNL